MPKKQDNTNTWQLTGPEQRMEEEINNREEEPSPAQKEEEIPDLTGIEDEEIEDKSGFIYKPEKFDKCFIPQNELAKKVASITLKYLLSKKKYPSRSTKTCSVKEAYIISRTWFEKWKTYSRYETMKRIIKAYSTYESRPIKYTPNEEKNPGEIKNGELLIRKKKEDKDRNILVSELNDSLDTRLNYKKENKKKDEKKDFVLLPKERFDLLNDYFKSDYILKTKRILLNENRNYNAFCVHLQIAFLPTLASFKKVNENNIEEFKKEHKIIYDIYFRQNAGKKEIVEELFNIFKEKPEIITNMGVDLIMEGDEDELSNHIKNLRFYIPNNKNQKSIQEIINFIFSDEIIEKIKKDEKIKEEELELSKVEYGFDLNMLFHLNWINCRNNIDVVPNGYIFLEYLMFDDEESQKVSSIFETKENINCLEVNNETSAPRENNEGPHLSHEPNSHHQHNPHDTYNLDNFSLDKNENKHGLVGLNNLGNTCYMNTGLQCLSNCELLTKYFLGDYYKEFINKDNPIGSQGEIVEKYSQLIHHLWYGNNEYISPIQFKRAFGKNYNAFADYRQQDSQEFISYLLDALHEDLNKVLKKPYIETKDLSPGLSEEEQFKIKKDLYLCRNQSFIVDLIYGFYKSTIYCPNEKCKNITKSFEPFNMITLSLVNEAQIRKLEDFQNEENLKKGIKIINVTFIPFKINNKPLKFPVKIKKGITIDIFKNKIEKITGFNKKTFEIYKMQENEFLPIKQNINLLEDFLNGENKLFLFQIPPYVFGKPLDYFDKTYEDLNNDHDKFFLEEEKYEGNDIYKEYNYKEKKSKTDDDIEKCANRINIDMDKDEETNEDEEKKKLNKSINDEDIEMKDDNLNIDNEQWVKAEFYNYTYSNEKNKENIKEEIRISNSRIIYINKEWDNTQIYIKILEMLEGARNDLPEIKTEWFRDIKEITKLIQDMEENEKKQEGYEIIGKNNILEFFDETINHPLMLQYLGVYNFNNTDIKEKKEKWKNIIFPFDPSEHSVKRYINIALVKNNKQSDIELLFKIIWRPSFSKEYKDGSFPIELGKSEKLEDILRAQREDEYSKTNNLSGLKKKGEKRNKKLNLEELLNNFNEKEKLSKDNQWYCPKCKQFQLADKKMELYEINEIMIIHLKRFRNNRKIDNLIEFPLEGLDLGNYLPNKNEKYIYDLFAVANHIGGLQGGHYFAYCKNFIDGEWYEFNDSNVSKISEKNVVTDNAYVLFYKRKREDKINEEELFKKPFVEIDYTKYTNN